MSLLTHLVLAASGLGGQPDPNGLPGSSALQQLISGLAFWALLAVARRTAHLRRRLGALLALRQLPPRQPRPARHDHLRYRRLPRRRRPRDRHLLREPRQDRALSVPGRDISLPDRPIRDRSRGTRSPWIAALVVAPRDRDRDRHPPRLARRSSRPRSRTLRRRRRAPPKHRAATPPSPDAHTRTGAVAAAARSITAFAGNVLLEPSRLRAVVARIARPARARG